MELSPLTSTYSQLVISISGGVGSPFAAARPAAESGSTVGSGSAKFYAEGLKINRVVARKTAATLGTAAGAVPRLRNASLNDARGVEESREADKTEENAK